MLFQGYWYVIDSKKRRYFVVSPGSAALFFPVTPPNLPHVRPCHSIPSYLCRGLRSARHQFLPPASRWLAHSAEDAPTTPGPHHPLSYAKDPKALQKTQMMKIISVAYRVKSSDNIEISIFRCIYIVYVERFLHLMSVPWYSTVFFVCRY